MCAERSCRGPGPGTCHSGGGPWRAARASGHLGAPGFAEPRATEVCAGSVLRLSQTWAPRRGTCAGGSPRPPLAVRLSGDGAQGQQAVLCPPSLSPGGRVTSRCPRARALQLVRLIGPSRATCRCPHPCHARSSRPAGGLPTRSWPSASRVLVLRFVTCWWRWLQLASPLSPGLGRSPWPPLRARAREQDCFGGVLPEWMWGTTVLSPTAAAQRVPGRRQSPGSGRGPRVSAA